MGNDGTVPFRNMERISFDWVLSQKFAGDQVVCALPFVAPFLDEFVVFLFLARPCYPSNSCALDAKCSPTECAGRG